jgi:hypothetical protein
VEKLDDDFFHHPGHRLVLALGDPPDAFFHGRREAMTEPDPFLAACQARRDNPRAMLFHSELSHCGSPFSIPTRA